MNAFECASKAGEIFALPDTCLKIKDIIDNETSDIDEIAEIISYDPVLSSKILRLANSALYSFPRQVDSVQKAVLLLGDTQVYNLVVASGATEAFSELDRDVIALEQFWEYSIHSALIAKHLAPQIGLKRDEPVYLSGLLHNIGQLVVAQVMPDLARQANQPQRGKKPWEVQRQALGFSYTDCSVELLKLWQLPERLLQPLIGLDDTSAGFANPVQALLHLSRCVALSEIDKDQFVLWELLDKSVQEQLGLSKAQIQEAVSFARLEGMAILSLLNPNLFMVF